jgi:hypothetical protein
MQGDWERKVRQDRAPFQDRKKCYAHFRRLVLEIAVKSKSNEFLELKVYDLVCGAILTIDSFLVSIIAESMFYQLN